MRARLELRDLPLDIAEHQSRWDALCHDPTLEDAPYKIETDAYGLLLLSPVPALIPWRQPWSVCARFHPDCAASPTLAR